MDIEVKKYKEFDVYHLEDNYSFFHIKISDEDIFYEQLSKFFLEEDNLIKYIENSKDIEIEADNEIMEYIYDLLYIFIDEKNDEMDITNLEENLKGIMQEEAEEVREEKTKTFIRLSKIGRFGEFIMSSILKDFFQFDCIIPKLKLTTDRNMSVYGIDTVYMNTDEKLLLFGESKISKNLDNAVKLINKSLDEYEKNIEEEYILIFKNNCLKKLKEFETYYNEQKSNGICLTFKDFITTANITKIGIPIFMAHGNEKDSQKIIEKLKKTIKRKNFFDIETEYYLISLPIIDKSKFTLTFTKIVKEKKEEYESIIRNSNVTEM